MTITRYAIYWAGQGGFAEAGARWLGWDNLTATDRVSPVPDWVGTPRKYGFHGTIKAPFRLAPGWSPTRLQAALAEICTRLAPLDLPGLRLARIGGFLALAPEGGEEALGALAFAVVQGLDPARAPLTEAEIARRRPETLSPQKRALLEAWGYPHVGPAFRFHLTLTSDLPADQLAAAETAVRAHFDPPRPFRFESLCLMAEEDGRFRLVSRHALTG